MEVLLVRIDLLRDRKAYVGILRDWLSELALPGARLATTGELHLLLAAGAPAQLSQLLAFFRERPIDTDAKGALCVDKFIDVLGRRAVEDGAAPAIKGFLEMNFLNTAMLDKMLVDEWRAERLWLETALATPRTGAFLAWRAAAKAQRSDRRKKAAQEKHAAKQQKQQDAQAKAAAAAADEDEGGGDSGDDADTRDAEDASTAAAAAAPSTERDAAAESQDESDDASAKVAAQQPHKQQATSRAPKSSGASRPPQPKHKQSDRPKHSKPQHRKPQHRKRREEQSERPHPKKLAKVRE